MMDKLTPDKNASKKVRLQGFKGFKLKNTQILIKSTGAFSNKQLGQSGRLLEKKSPVKVAEFSTLSGSKYLQYVRKPSIAVNSKYALTKDENKVNLQNHSTSENTPSNVLLVKKESSSAQNSFCEAPKEKIAAKVSSSEIKMSESSQQMAKLQDSSSAGSSDDIDEVMRRTREKRKLLNKSSETYTPRKKARENENHCQMETSALENLITYESEQSLKRSPVKDFTSGFLADSHSEKSEAEKRVEVQSEDGSELKIVSSSIKKPADLENMGARNSSMHNSTRESPLSEISPSSPDVDKVEKKKATTCGEKVVEKALTVKTPPETNLPTSNECAPQVNEDIPAPPFLFNNESKNTVVWTNSSEYPLDEENFCEKTETKEQSFETKVSDSNPHLMRTDANTGSISPSVSASSPISNSFEIASIANVSPPASSVVVTSSIASSLKDLNQTFHEDSATKIKLVYPAKKRYHEWFNSVSASETSAANEQTHMVNHVGAATSVSDSLNSSLSSSVITVPCTVSQQTVCDDSIIQAVTSNDEMTKTVNVVSASSDSDKVLSDDAAAHCEDESAAKVSEKPPVSSLVETDEQTSDFATNVDSQAGEFSTTNSSAIQTYQENSDPPSSTGVPDETVARDHEISKESSSSPIEKNNTFTEKPGVVDDIPETTLIATEPLADESEGLDSPQPLLYSGDVSPIIGYAISDDQTSSSVGSMSPADIRIPIDNCDFSESVDNPTSVSETVDHDTQFEPPAPPGAARTPSPPVKQESKNNKPPAFLFIEGNLYLFQKKKSRARKEIRRMLCECIRGEEETPCGENCLNRLLMIECSPRCPFGDRCTNKRFQHREFVQTEVFETSWKGWGLQASEPLSRGTLVMEYCGEVLDPVEFRRRSQLYSLNNQQHFYFMALSQSEIIDATYKGNNSRFINHSCDPNCETQKWTVNGRLRVGFFTIKEVKVGEEITFDYQFERYGKEAQKCYCGAANCRGFLGQPPKQNNSMIYNRSLSTELEPNKNIVKDTTYELGTGLQEFKQNTLENEISRLTNGLQTTKEVLLLSRLMVRCDTLKERLLCLKVIRKSDNQASLRAFLHFHGLTLIWSWMVDSVAFTDDNSNDVFRLKVEILNTLAVLPINNKNMLEDSKVMSMVKRWSVDTKVSGSNQEEASSNVGDENDDEDVKEQIGESDQSASNLLNSSAIDERKELCKRVVILSTQLLNVWKNLKEVYRIPKRQKSSNSANATTSADSDHSVQEPALPKTSTSSSSGKSRRYERERSPIVTSQSSYRDKYTDLRSEERKHSPLKIKEKDDESKSSKIDTGDQYAWLETSKNVRLSRKEHRRQFERIVQNKNEKKTESSDPAPTPTTQQQTAATPVASTTPQNLSANTISTAVDDVTFTPSGYSGNLIQINPTPVHPAPVQCSSVAATQSLSYLMSHSIAQTDPVLSTSYLNNSSLGQPISVIGGPPAPSPQLLPPAHPSMYLPSYTMQPTSQLASTYPATVNNSGVTILGYDGLNAIVLLTPEQLKELTDLLAFKALQQSTVPTTFLSHQSMPVLPQPVQQTILQPAQVVAPANPLVVPTNQSVVSVNHTVVPSTQGLSSTNQAVVAAADQLAVSQNNSPAPNKASSDPALAISETSSETSNVVAVRSPPRDPRPLRLPPNWKTASDPDGCVYYYHVITRQTQWDPPTWDAAEEDMVEKKEEEMEISTPTMEGPNKKNPEKPTATAITASDADQAKKAKEAFRSRMSQHIVTCLSSYRKSDCKIGRITTTEDFKRLARKLTYNILMKEIKQVQVWEDLECNANVKHKAKEYVRKYMAKMGPVYKSKDDESSK